MGQLLVDQLLPRPRIQSDLDVGLFNFASGDRDLFDIKRNAQIFWSPLLIGHALPSVHGSKQVMPRRYGQFLRKVRVKYPRISGRLAAVPLGRSLVNRRCCLRFLGSLDRFSIFNAPIPGLSKDHNHT